MTLPNWDSQTSVLLGLAAFQLAGAWSATAPTLSDMRAASPGDIATRQRLLDADLSVGSLAVLIGAVIGILTKEWAALFVMVGVFGALSLWSHAILAADER